MLLALGTVVAGAWLLWPRVTTRMTSQFVAAPVAASAASAELAEAALDRFEAFRAGLAGERLAMSDAELSSVVRYAIPGILPPGVSEPEVTLEGGSLTLAARVAIEAFPDLPALDQVVGILPDTVPVRMEGELGPVQQGVRDLPGGAYRGGPHPAPRPPHPRGSSVRSGAGTETGCRRTRCTCRCRAASPLYM